MRKIFEFLIVRLEVAFDIKVLMYLRRNAGVGMSFGKWDNAGKDGCPKANIPLKIDYLSGLKNDLMFYFIVFLFLFLFFLLFRMKIC